MYDDPIYGQVLELADPSKIDHNALAVRYENVKARFIELDKALTAFDESEYDTEAYVDVESEWCRVHHELQLLSEASEAIRKVIDRIKV